MHETADPRKSCGVVVIGRNEGDRLVRCIDSVAGIAAQMVYVDSGSSDGSVAMARAKGLAVVELDMSVPFTAARARNAGFEQLRQTAPNLAYVQFVDGDCEVNSGWLAKAVAFLDANPDVVVVCGRRRERFPERTIYNALCDIEWNTPVGSARSCGGDSMMRIKNLSAVGGFRPDLIAGEEPELCVRLRARGGKIWRLGEEMTLHDAAMTRFGQWWNRSKRAGYAYATGAMLHGRAPERHYVPQAKRALLWGLIVPAGVCGGLAVTPLSLWFLIAYPLQIIRNSTKGNWRHRITWVQATFQILGRFPEALGMLSYSYDRLLGKKSVLIEYK